MKALGSMANKPWDALIVGQGLAGTTLAWHLIEAGQRVLVVDDEAPVTSSKIAAGLITPITGQRLALTWRGDDFLPAARNFYQRIEQRTGQSFFHSRTAVRVFKSDTERDAWAERKRQPAFQSHVLDPQPDPLLDPDIADTRGGGFAMQSAQLDVACYLNASRAALDYQPMAIDWHRDVTFDMDAVVVQGQRTRRLISCEGYAAARNPYFTSVPFIAAKGEILTVRFQCSIEPVCLHHGVWVAPTANANVFRIGSTYDWETLDQIPTCGARSEIETKLQAFVRMPYTVIDHHAAVRPIIQESKPLIGLHPRHQGLGFFNGLGSKGSLLAPWYAQRLADFLVRGVALPDNANVQKHFNP